MSARSPAPRSGTPLLSSAQRSWLLVAAGVVSPFAVAVPPPRGATGRHRPWL